MIMKLIRNITFGKMKMWQQRLSTYVSMINFAMLLYLFIVENKWFSWYIWVIIVSLGTVFLIIFDVLIVMEQQSEYGFMKNPEWRKHKRNQKRIMEKLGLEYEE